MTKKYEEYDRSTPEKRGYAVRKALFDSDTNGPIGASSSDTVKNMFRTGPDQNIGPRMDAEGVKNRTPIEGETLTSDKKRQGKWQAGFDKAKAESQEPIGPKFKKGGSVSSASSRADGIASKGKTRGRII